MTNEEISEEHAGMVQAIATLTDKRGEGLKTISHIAYAIVMIIALWTAYVQTAKNERVVRDTQDRLICAGRYQDRVDAGQTALLATTGELVVLITQVPPGDARKEAVAHKVTELQVDSEVARKVVNAKAQYNNDGRPLPCPIGDVEPIQPETSGT